MSKLISYFSLNIGLAQNGNVFNWIESASNFIPEEYSINKYINKKDKEWIILNIIMQVNLKKLKCYNFSKVLNNYLQN